MPTKKFNGSKRSVNKKISISSESSTDSGSSSTEDEIGNIREIIINDIDDNYSYAKYSGFKVIMMKQNGYINCTKMCQYISTVTDSKKPFKNWINTTIAKELLDEISLTTDISVVDLMIVITGGRVPKIRGTYVHPLLVTHIAYWCGPRFAIKISMWIEEWKKHSPENELRYWTAIRDIKPSRQADIEKQIQHKLHKKLGGEIEVRTMFGRIDLLTSDAIIEIKKYDDWKCAIGQICAYSTSYPNKQKMIYLFNVPENNILDDIKIMCRDMNIKVKKINY